MSQCRWPDCRHCSTVRFLVLYGVDGSTSSTTIYHLFGAVILENTDIKLTTETRQAITTEQAWHYRVIPKALSSTSLEFYIDEHFLNDGVQNELEILFGKSVTFHQLPSASIEQTLNRFYLRNNNSTKKNVSAVNLQSDEMIVQLISEAKTLGSSDIHIETYEEKCRIRIRIDGQLIERAIIRKGDYPALINRIKIMSNLDIAEKRLPQDGRIFYNQQGYKFDIRVSVLPTLYGEKIVLRLLANDAQHIDIHLLGFSDHDARNYLEAVKRPTGIILISGPTGSGKTTTLYATLKLLNSENRNVLTVEDPIEYTLPGINQVQVKESIGLDFARALRTFLRQDPDVIMLGEIRDSETATMAVRAALTGHLVLSTIHTNSAWGTIDRLLDMGIPSYLLASTLNTTVAQRLIRLLCPHCKREQEFDHKHFPGHFKPFQEVKTHFVAGGCNHCYHTGYKGRRAIYQVVPIDQTLAGKIRDKESEVSEILRERHINSLAENAFKLFADGETTIEEIYPLLYNV
jgi:type IV pilus assembly protein PilB